MTSVFPSLEGEFDYSSCKGALILLTGYASPEQLRRVGETRLTAWLRRRRVRNYAAVAARALTAARAQYDHAARPRHRRRDHRRARPQHPDPRPAPHRPRCPDRCDLRSTPPGRHHRVHARIRSHSRCHTARRRRRADRISQRRTPRRRSRARAGPQRLGRRTGNLHKSAATAGRCGTCSTYPRKPA